MQYIFIDKLGGIFVKELQREMHTIIKFHNNSVLMDDGNYDSLAQPRIKPHEFYLECRSDSFALYVEKD